MTCLAVSCRAVTWLTHYPALLTPISPLQHTDLSDEEKKLYSSVRLAASDLNKQANMTLLQESFYSDYGVHQLAKEIRRTANKGMDSWIASDSMNIVLSAMHAQALVENSRAPKAFLPVSSFFMEAVLRHGEQS